MVNIFGTKTIEHEFAGEVDEQLNLLIELVPEWISEKTGSSGHILCW